MNSAEFRKEIVKIMPGYNWTVHRSRNPGKHLSATGIKSSGFNRLSTLSVTRRENESGYIEYECKAAGYGTKTPWLATATDGTLARSLRSLQNDCDHWSRKYGSMALALENARSIPRKAEGEPPCHS